MFLSELLHGIFRATREQLHRYCRLKEDSIVDSLCLVIFNRTGGHTHLLHKFNSDHNFYIYIYNIVFMIILG